MEQSNKIVMLMGFMVDSEETVRKYDKIGKLLSIVGMSAIMSRIKGESSDKDTALASNIKILSSHHDLADVRFDLTEELESVALNVAPALSQFDLDAMRILSQGIQLIDMVGELMVGEQEKEQINAVS